MPKEESETPSTIPFRDQTALELFWGFVLAISALYGFAYNDWSTAGYALVGPILLHFYTRSEWYDPLIVGHRFYDELTESGIVLLIFFSSIWFFPSLLEPLGLIVSFILPLLITSIVCLLFLIIIRKYTRNAIGLTREGTSYSKDFMLIFLLITIGLAVFRIALLNSGSLFANPILLLQVLMFSFFVFALPVGFTEELVFRGVLQPRLVTRLKSRMLGLVATSIIFSAAHILTVWSSSTIIQGGLFQALLIATLTRLPVGVVLGMTWDMTQNLISPVTIHVLYNTIAYLLLAASYMGV